MSDARVVPYFWSGGFQPLDWTVPFLQTARQHSLLLHASESRMPLLLLLPAASTIAALRSQNAACGACSARTELLVESCSRVDAAMGSQDRQKLAYSYQRVHSEAVVLPWQELERRRAAELATTYERCLPQQRGLYPCLPSFHCAHSC
jgi:hypothetical protein